MDNLLIVESLTKRFPIDRRSAIWAVNEVSFTIDRGETLGLVGESGSGKTTVGRCVLRLLESDFGRIIFDGVDISTLSDTELRALRSRISIVFQDPHESLNPRRTVLQTVEEPLILQGELGEAERIERVTSTLGAVQLSEQPLSRYPNQLTDSEKQRVGIARAIVTQPDLIIVDEAISNLDPAARADILDVFIDLQSRFGVSYLFISHDMTAVERVSHRIAIMYLGRIVETAPADNLFNKQLHPYSKGLLSSVLYPDPTQNLEPFILKGEIPSAIDIRDECSLIVRCPFAIPECAKSFPPLVEVQQDHFSACYRSDEFVDSGVPSIVNPSLRVGQNFSKNTSNRSHEKSN